MSCRQSQANLWPETAAQIASLLPGISTRFMVYPLISKLQGCLCFIFGGTRMDERERFCPGRAAQHAYTHDPETWLTLY
ncbi:hypothetical protein M408DRAFT_325850, partial [Serendipita vermifera MAFF 305830]